MAEKNYYDVLGVSKTASQDEIKAAYRKLVKQYHPDLHPNDAECAAKFKEVNEANEILSDPDKRKQYDFELENPYARGYGNSAAGTGDPFAGFGDIFSTIFGGFNSSAAREPARRRGKDITYELELSFLDAALGCTKEINYTRKDKCADCRGTGAKNGTALKQCSACGGTGQIKYTSGSGFFRTITTRPCAECDGTGKIITENCPTCRGKGTAMVNTKVRFDIPAGADKGSYIKRKGYGETPDKGGDPGDLIIFFIVKPHKLFSRKDFNIYVTVPISFKTACFGGKVKIPGLDKAFEYSIPDGIQSGKTVCFKGKGIHNRSKTGDMYVTFQVETPVRLSRQQKEAISALYDGMENKQNPMMNSYKDNMSKDFGMNPYDNQ
ncbi:MAG: molecular chaperone DnaJ [Clostridia bacterium]|nr:molecular chaperone DnaJ [Clostridia bacterium]